MNYIEAIGLSLEKKKILLGQPDACSWIYSHQVQPHLNPLPSIKNIIAVASGKGGVGKSTIAFNLAHACSLAGLQVGILDADIYGPSLPTLSGIHEKAYVRPEKCFEPHYAFGMKILSIGHLVDAQEALIWRGPMATGALMQLFSQTAWGRLDILFVDLPPGTGDILLTLCQKIPLAGVVMVRNLHPLAEADYLRAITLFNKTKVPILGTVLNHQFPTVSQPEPVIIGQLLAELPYSQALYESAIHGMPIEQFEKSEKIASSAFRLLAENTVDALAQQPIHQQIPIQIKTN